MNGGDAKFFNGDKNNGINLQGTHVFSLALRMQLHVSMVEASSLHNEFPCR